jgi:pimeloyl-ACP methyl ester carboxylesterase
VLYLAALLVAVVVAIAIAGASYHSDLHIPQEFKGQFIEVMGNRIRYFQTGAGQDILLIHGCPGSIEDWDPIIGPLSQTFRVTAYDRPGHGYSGAEGALYTYDYNATVALALIETIRLRDVVVVGHSYGGAIAMSMALARPIDVRSFVVVDSSLYGLPRQPDPVYRALAIPVFGMGLARWLAPWLGPVKIRAELQGLFPTGQLPEDFLALRTAMWTQPKVAVATAKENLEASEGLAAMSPHYPGIEHPVFVMAGEADPHRRSAAEMLRRDVARAQLFLVRGGGHYIQFQDVPGVLAVIGQAASAPQ